MQADAGGADSMPRWVYGLRCSLKRKRAMDKTRAVAHLPNSLRARPSFAALARWLEASGPASAPRGAKR
jgi:hypothetical protein